MCTQITEEQVTQRDGDRQQETAASEPFCFPQVQDSGGAYSVSLLRFVLWLRMYKEYLTAPPYLVTQY